MQPQLPIENTVLKEIKKIKNLLTTNTFRVVFSGAVILLAPLIGEAIKEKKLTVDNGVKMVVIVATAAGGIRGRMSGNDSLVYTEDWMPGVNKSDFLPLPVEEGERVEGLINESGVASVSESEHN